MRKTEDLTDEQMAQLQAENGYVAVRRLEDGSVATLVDLAYTRAICLGATIQECFTTNRFCFENRAWADREFALLKTKHDVPEGYIARRPEVRNPDGSYA